MKNKGMRRVLVAACLAVLIASLLTVQVAALKPSYKVSAAYKDSTYHQNLLSLPLVGDGAFDTLSVALSQYGYHEGASTADFHGTNGAGKGNFTEYGYAHGKVGGTYGYAWCAVFVSWCLSQAGEAKSAGGAFSSCSLWIARLRELGQYTSRSAHTPKMGDIIFFRTSGVSRASDHVGLVLDVRGGRVYTVEGNSSERVALRSYALTDTYIVGYGRPDYENKAQTVVRRTHEDVSAGYYVVSYDFLNVRAARSSSATKKGQLDKGELVRVSEVKNGWGRIEYEGGTAYISLDYADFVTPSKHQISYVSEGKTLLSREFWSTDAPTVAVFTPEREGYEFLGWRDAAEKEYAPSQPLPAADLVLTAVWREIPPPPPPELPEDEGEDAPEDGTDALPPETESVPESTPESAPTPDVLPPSVLTPQAPDYTLAEWLAGGITALVAAAWIGAWYWLRKKRA